MQSPFCLDGIGRGNEDGFGGSNADDRAAGIRDLGRDGLGNASRGRLAMGRLRVHWLLLKILDFHVYIQLFYHFTPLHSHALLKLEISERKTS